MNLKLASSIASVTQADLVHPLIGIAWLGFTLIHFCIMMFAFASASLLALLGLCAFYSLFFLAGIAMLYGHIKGWRQNLIFGNPRLMTESIILADQKAQFSIKGFKSSVANQALKASLLYQTATARSTGNGLQWSDQWESSGIDLKWLPDFSGKAGSVSAHASDIPVVPQAQTDHQKPQRWFIQLKGFHGTGQEKSKWLFALSEEQVKTFGLTFKSDLQHLDEPLVLTVEEARKSSKVLLSLAVITAIIATALLLHNLLGQLRFSPFKAMFSVYFFAVAYQCFQFAYQLRNAGQFQSKEQFAKRFKRFVKWMPPLFFVAFAWEFVMPFF